MLYIRISTQFDFNHLLLYLVPVVGRWVLVEFPIIPRQFCTVNLSLKNTIKINEVAHINTSNKQFKINFMSAKQGEKLRTKSAITALAALTFILHTYTHSLYCQLTCFAAAVAVWKEILHQL